MGKGINWYFTATTRCISFMDFIRATLQIMLFRFRFLSQRSNDANELARAILQHSQITCISCKCAPFVQEYFIQIYCSIAFH